MDTKPKLVIIDEAHLFLDNDDSLKEQLREIEGVPQVAYLVNGDKVFVYAALIRHIKMLRQQRPDTSLSDLVDTALPDAWVSAEDAVGVWDIVPVPYEVEVVGDGFVISHKFFESRLPRVYLTDADRKQDLATLLLGGVVPGDGDFSFRGQPMMLAGTFDPDTLTDRPALDVDGIDDAGSGYSVLGGVSFVSGFPPVSQDRFDKIKALAGEWSAANMKIGRHVGQRADELWAQISHIPLDMLKDDDAFGDGYRDELAGLRVCYPELDHLSDSSLYWLFDYYQNDCCRMRSWEPSRGNGFLFYLLGRAAADNADCGEVAEDAGKYVGYCLLGGMGSSSAFEAGRQWFAYHRAVNDLAYRVWDVMRYLREISDKDGNSDPRVTTFGDMFRRGRKYGSEVITVTQTLEQLEAVVPEWRSVLAKGEI